MAPAIALVVASLFLAAPPTHAAGVSEAPRLSAIYDAILGARFDQARTQLASACPPAPREGCLALDAVALWWEIQIDPYNRGLDQKLEASSAAAIDAADRWSRREPSNAEAWFYLAGSYGPIEQLRVIRGDRLKAARAAVTIRSALERALTLDPTLQDAHFGIGLYRYVADVAPTTLKILRWLLLMPGGNRAEGLREMLDARERSVLLRGEADYQLHWLFLWYEHQPRRALDLLKELDDRYPSNPLFLQRIAEIQRDYLHDHNASLASWRMLLDRASRGVVSRVDVAGFRARIGIANELVALSDPQRALDALGPLQGTRPSAPHGADSLIQLTAGRAYARVGDKNRAMNAFRAAIAAAPSDDPENIRARARTLITQGGIDRE